MSLTLFVPFVIHDFVYTNSIILIRKFRVPFYTVSYIQIGEYEIRNNVFVYTNTYYVSLS